MWNNIVLEGFCFGESKGKCPCGKTYPTTFCLRNGHCPHFAYSASTEREAACFVPLWFILKDRLAYLFETLWESISWFFWGQLWFNRRKVDKFFKDIKVATRNTDPSIAKLEDAMIEANEKFAKWLAS